MASCKAMVLPMHLLLLHISLWGALDVCGAPEGGGSRIIGGEPAGAEDFPYVVSLRSTDSGEHLCGAVAVTGRHVLTATRCTRGYDASALHIVAGSTALTPSAEKHVKISVEEKTEHDGYDEKTWRHNIAVLRLSTSLPSTILPVPLVTGYLPDGAECSVAGWGLEDASATGGHPAEVLQKVVVPYIGHTVCTRYYGAYEMVDETNICAGPEEGGKGICTMDYGGPLTCSGVLVGVASASFGCASPYYPGIFTDLQYYGPWVMEVTNQEAVQASTLYPVPTSTLYPVPTSTPYPVPTSTPYPVPTSTPYPVPTSTPSSSSVSTTTTSSTSTSSPSTASLVVLALSLCLCLLWA